MNRFRIVLGRPGEQSFVELNGNRLKGVVGVEFKVSGRGGRPVEFVLTLQGSGTVEGHLPDEEAERFKERFPR